MRKNLSINGQMVLLDFYRVVQTQNIHQNASVRFKHPHTSELALDDGCSYHNLHQGNVGRLIPILVHSII